MQYVPATNSWSVSTLFKYRFSGKIVVKSEQLFDNLQRAHNFNHQNRGVDRIPSITKKRLLMKKFKKPLLGSFQQSKSTQISRAVCADRIEQVKMTKFELELINYKDCFNDDHGIFTTNLVSFQKISLQTNHLLNS